MQIYLNACCINRPFDDQTQERIRLEAEAVILILNRIETGELEWLGSEILDFELAQTSDPEKALRMSVLTRYAHSTIRVETAISEQALEWEKLGFDAYDALHLACAVKGDANVFLTTDDSLVTLARSFSDILCINVKNPLVWIREVTES
jgi:predicted nucleic acid-binding protein